jgi:hypothetical protein
MKNKLECLSLASFWDNPLFEGEARAYLSVTSNNDPTSQTYRQMLDRLKKIAVYKHSSLFYNI